MDDQEMLGLKDVVLDDFTPTSQSPASRLHREWQVRAKDGPFAVDPAICVVWPGNTRDVNSLSSDSFGDLIDSVRSVGQQVPVIARISSANPELLELVAGACRLAAIHQINVERESDAQMQIVVDLRDIDDAAALKIVDAENRGRSDMTQYEKACFYARAIPGIYATEQDLAAALGVNKSTVNRTLAIARLPSELTSLIKDRHAISAAQASQFLTDWNLPALRDTLNDAIAKLMDQGPTSAAQVFRALREAVAPPVAADTVRILHDEQELGSVRRKKSGGIVIELHPEAGTLGWKGVAHATGVALKQLGPANPQ